MKKIVLVLLILMVFLAGCGGDGGGDEGRVSGTETGAMVYNFCDQCNDNNPATIDLCASQEG